MNPLSKNEEEIKKVLNRQEFEFAEPSWEAAKELLDREMPVQKKKKRGLFWFFLIALPALLAASGWWAYTHQQQLFSSAPGTTPVIDSTTSINLYTTPNTAKIHQSSNDTNYATTIIENMDSGSIENNEDTEYTVQGGPPTLMVARMAEQKDKARQKHRHQNASTPNTRYTQKRTTPARGAQTPNPATGDDGTQPAQHSGTKSYTNAGNDDITPPGGDSPVAATQQNDRTKKEAPSIPLTDGDNDDKTTTTNDEQRIDEGNPKDTKLANDPVVPPVAPVPALPKADNTDTVNNIPPQTDSTTQAGSRKKNPEPEKYKNFISPIAGFGLSRVLNPAQLRFNGTPYLGVLYRGYLADKWHFMGGFAYTQVNTQDLNKQYTSEVYSFGVQRQQTTVLTSKLHYLQMPLWLSYTPEKYKFISLFGGVAPGYLLNTQNSLSQSSYSTLNGHTPATSNNATAYRKGINNWDLQWNLGIETNFNRFHLGILAGGGLTDVTANAYYNNSVIDRNRRVQLYIKYDVIRF